ncbi:hypothetical protein CK203_101940 [Vitis vinifera]|uniref:Uncharacterized protein n=1 Tax=Vitis vinifera TaxID=29760 RepID=A0A438BQ10_VITVI|nr:hypothetical protein CK203_101940 [Vitis vinifera]
MPSYHLSFTLLSRKFEKICLLLPSFWQALDAEDLLTGNYTIDDVVLPLPG